MARGRFRSAYDLVELRYSDALKAMWLVDVNGAISVTNDAERVCDEMNQLYPTARIFYRDSDGNWDELRHDRGHFTGFAPARFAGHPRGAPIPDSLEVTRG